MFLKLYFLGIILCFQKVFFHCINGGAMVQCHRAFKIQVETPVVHVGAANDSGLIIRENHFCVNEPGGIFKNTDAGF